MKQYKKIIPFALTLVAMASCADDSILEYSVDKPLEIAAMEYVNKYDALKTYVDRQANPHFKLGTGVSVGDYVSCHNFCTCLISCPRTSRRAAKTISSCQSMHSLVYLK